MLSIRPFLAAAVLALWMPAAAQAAVISETESFGTTALLPAMPPPLTFSQFDSTLGTLDHVTITLEARITGTTTVTRTGGTAGFRTPTGSTTRTLTLQLSSVPLANLELDDVDPWTTAVGPGGTKIETQSVSVLDSIFLNNSNVLAFFIGGSTYDFDLEGLVTHNLAPTGNGIWTFAANGFAAGSVTVAYDYTKAPEPGPTDVPEPAVLGLLGIGLLGLGLVAHRRRRMG